MSDDGPKSSGSPSNELIEQRTWDWFHAAVALRFGPAHFRIATLPPYDHWPDVIAMRGHDRVGFEITSPLKPEDVVKRPRRDTQEDIEIEGMSRQRMLEQRVVGALKRKIKKYGSTNTGMPLALLITLAHPSTLKFSSTKSDIAHLASVVRGHFGKFLHQPIDAVYLVGPGEKAFLLWRRRGPKWKKIFPDLDDIAQRT